MDDNSHDSFSNLEENVIKMINDFDHSCSLLNKSDSQVLLWLDTVDNVVANILDVYKICFLTRNNRFCQNVVDSLDGLKKMIKSIATRENKEASVTDPDNKMNYKVQDTSPCKNNFGKNITSEESSIMFGDVDYELIMNDLKKDKLCPNYTSLRKTECNSSKNGFSDSSSQTDLNISNFSFRKRVGVCSIGIQVENMKRLNLNYSGNHFSSDYNLNDPYMCNQNFEGPYQNVHYYNDSCSFQSEIDQSYQDHINNFPHQYQPLPCSSVPLPGRNISAPVFLPRLISSPSPVHHTSDHHHSSLPYAITMFSSSQSYIPGMFTSSVNPPQHFSGITSHGHKESKKSHRKSEMCPGKKIRGSTSKSKHEARSLQVREKYMSHFIDSYIDPSESCEKQMGYLAKIDLVEKACNFDITTCQYYFPNIDLASSSDKKSGETHIGISNGFAKEDTDLQYNLITDFQAEEVKLSKISELQISEDKSNFSKASETEKSSHNKGNSFSDKNTIEFSESPEISVLNEVYDHISKCRKSNNTSSLINECSFPSVISFDPQINSGSSLEAILPVIESHNNKLDDTVNVKKMDVKLSFVNVLTAGLKMSADTNICSIERTSSIDKINEIDCKKTHQIKPPNVFELSHFPSLKPSSQHPINNSGQVLYFGQCKPRVSSMYDTVGNIEKTMKADPNIFNTSLLNRPSILRVDEKRSFSGKPKESDSSKKQSAFVNKGYALKKNLSYCDNKRGSENKNSRCSYQIGKHSNISSNSKNVKEEVHTISSNMEKKMEGHFNGMYKKCKPEELFQSKRNAISKRKSVPGEDGWTVIQARLRNPDCWNSKELVDKRINDFTLLSDDIMNNTPEITPEIDNDCIKIDSSGHSESNCYSLTHQQRSYFSSSVRLDHSASFFDENDVAVENFDTCHKLTVNETGAFALSSIGIIDQVEGILDLQDSSLDKISDSNFSQPDYHMPPSSLVNLNSNSECSDGANISDVQKVDYLKIKSFLDKSSIKDDNISVNGFDQTNTDVSNQISLFDSNTVLNDETCFLDDFKFNKWPMYEESEIANFLAYSLSSWSELKPDTDSEDQHLNEEDVRKTRELQEEALMLRKKIKDLELNENEIDTENEAEFENDNTENIDPHEIFTEYSRYLSQISWGDQIDEMERFQEMLSSDPNDSIFKFQYGSIEQFREFVARYPGKALDLHYKLLGRSKRSNSDEQYEIRRKKAEEKRQKLLNRKAAKMRELLQRVAEVRQAQLQIIEERKCRIEFKLKKAEENRNLHLKTIQKKAHDEEEKLKEIAFINELEAQNRRHDSMALRQEQEERIQNIIEERQRKVDEKAAKEAAVGERKRALEAERMEKIEKIQLKRRQKEENIGKKQQERELERLVTAREKAREREERLQARHAAQIANVEELQKKIKKKQENSARRHEENIQHIRQKAVETGMLRNLLSEDSNSDVSSKNSSSVEKKKITQISVYEIEQHALTKNQRKKCRKLRCRLQKNGAEYIMHLEHSSQCKDGSEIYLKLKTNVECIIRLTERAETSSDSGILKLEKQLCKMFNNISKNPESRSSFRLVKGFEVLQKIFVHLINSEELSISISHKCINWICKIFVKACENEFHNIQYFISCSYFCDFLDAVNCLFSDLLCSKMEPNLSVVQISAMLLAFLEMILRHSFTSKGEHLISEGLLFQLKDLVSYLLLCGLLKKVGDILKLASLEPVECLICEHLIEPIVRFVTRLIHPLYIWKEFEELLLTTDFMGTVSLLYGHLHQAQQFLPSFTLSIINFFRALASEQLQLFQKVLGAEGISLQFRYIASFVLQHCILSAKDPSLVELLDHTILVIGYFALKNHDNQLILQSGQTPTVLQQLISLPLQYFCEPKLKCVLFPTLIAICEGNQINRELLENEMSYNHIERFLEDPISDNAELMRVLRS